MHNSKDHRTCGIEFYCVLSLVCYFLVMVQPAESAAFVPPLQGIASARSRQEVVKEACSYLGTPYKYGGATKSGFDCSGLVFLCFRNATGKSIPRSTEALASWVLIIPQRELEPGDLVFFSLTKAGTAHSLQPDHVGIYVGDGLFIHAASRGDKTGVIESSLRESNWRACFLFAGRALPASTFSGFATNWNAGLALGQFDTLAAGAQVPFVRGVSGLGALSLPLAHNFEVGIGGGAEWDRSLGVLRIPLELSLGQSAGFSVFIGPAFNLGIPSLSGRDYTPAGTFLMTGGIKWSVYLANSGMNRWGVYVRLAYNTYQVTVDQPARFFTDLEVYLSLSIGIFERTVYY